MATCPKCDDPVTVLAVHPMTAQTVGTSFKAVCYVCTSCDAVLGAGLDPMVLKAAVVAEVLNGLRERSRC